MGAPMIEVQFFIPLKDNTGAAFDQAHDDQFAAELLRHFPAGYSVLPGLVAGQWYDPKTGTVYTDLTRVFAVWVLGLLAEVSNIRATARFAKKHYRQRAIAVRYLGHAEVIQ